jgi:hypothetical protein
MLRVVLVLLTSIALVRGGIWSEDEAKPLSKGQLLKFLGKDTPTSMVWSKTTAVDFNVYHGHAQPPLSGVVHIYVGGFPPFFPDASLPTVNGSLGIYSVKWQKRVLNDSSLRFETVAALHSDYWKAYVVVEAKSQYDADRVFEEISKLQMFNQMPKIIGTP